MKLVFPLVGGILMAGVVATSVVSQDDLDPTLARAIDARQSHMRLNAFNLGVLGAMAKGEMEYDAVAASAAAGNLAALASIDETRYWVPGTDMETLGKERTEALAAIWAEGGDIAFKAQSMTEAADAMVGAAGGGIDALRGAMGPLGKACGSCHEDYRVADE